MIKDSAHHVVVLGLMGVGKSTTAQALATARSLACFDSDIDIQATFDLTGAEIADRLGIDELHQIEAAMLLGRLASPEPSVISAAAWIVEDELCRQALTATATVVVLQASINEILRRAATGAHRRVIDEAELRALAERRAPLFNAVADLELDATLPTAELVALIQEHLGAQTAS